MDFRSPAVRDGLALVAVFAVLLGGLYLYTGIWPPAVIVESGSMMHSDADVTYGRIGTIDPGDLVLVKEATTVEDVQTLVEGGKEHYGKSGDVIVYYPANARDRVPIIHRAVAYIEVIESDGGTAFRVRWNADAPCVGGAIKDGAWCVYDGDGVNLPLGDDIDLRDYRPIRSGFVTKGDNPVTNRDADQITGLSRDANGERSPVMVEWIEGKARAELPWLGLIKLSLAPRYNQEGCDSGPLKFHFFKESTSSRCRGWYALGHAYAPKDLWVMLVFALFVLIGVPLLVDVYKNVKAKQVAATSETPLAPPPAPPLASPPASAPHVPPVESHGTEEAAMQPEVEPDAEPTSTPDETRDAP